MTDIVEVAVYAKDGRSSQLATFHGWRKKDDGWWADVMIYGPREPGSGSGMYRDVIPADRVLPLIYCGRHPSGQIAHSAECLAQGDDPGKAEPDR